MGGGGGILGSITELLFGKTKNPTVSIPVPEVAAPPAPVVKQDTGAIIQTGAPDPADDRVSRAGTRGSVARRSSTLDGFGQGW